MDAKEFEDLVGRKPFNDDLHRVNCIQVGSIGHLLCGICDICGKPNFICGGSSGHKYEFKPYSQGIDNKELPNIRVNVDRISGSIDIKFKEIIENGNILMNKLLTSIEGVIGTQMTSDHEISVHISNIILQELSALYTRRQLYKHPRGHWVYRWEKS